MSPFLLFIHTQTKQIKIFIFIFLQNQSISTHLPLEFTNTTTKMDEPAPPKQNYKGPKVIPAKNKTPAPVQITAEQLLREAKERQLEYVAPVNRFNLTQSSTTFY